MLKRTISTDARVAQLSTRSALLYTMSIPHLDREGRMAGSPVAVRGAVVPALAELHSEEWTDDRVASYIAEWMATTDEVTGSPRPLVLHYCIRGVWVCQFLGFHKNQKLRWDREASSAFAEPPLELAIYLETDEDASPPVSPSLNGRSFTPLDPIRSKADQELLRLLLRNRARQMEKRARDKGRYTEHVDLYAIAEEAGWNCHVCEQPILILRGRESESLSFDHLVPLDDGGMHVAGNLAPAHFGCNASKRVRALSRYSRPEVEVQAQDQELPPAAAAIEGPPARDADSRPLEEILEMFEEIFRTPARLRDARRERLQRAIETLSVEAVRGLFEQRLQDGARPRSIAWFLPALEERAAELRAGLRRDEAALERAAELAPEARVERWWTATGRCLRPEDFEDVLAELPWGEEMRGLARDLLESNWKGAVDDGEGARSVA